MENRNAKGEKSDEPNFNQREAHPVRFGTHAHRIGL